MQENIKTFCERLKEVMIKGGSINQFKSQENLWDADNFRYLLNVIKENPYPKEEKTDKNGKKVKGADFQKKFLWQLEQAFKNKVIKQEQTKSLLMLMIEVMSLYYVFPSHISIQTKESALLSLIEAKPENELGLNLAKDNFPVSLKAINAGGIGSGGMGFNTNKEKEILFLLNFFKSWYKDEVSREKLLNDNLAFQNFIDGLDNNTPQCRHVLLYFLFPEYYERIISLGQKNKIADIFSGFYTESELREATGQIDLALNVDQKIRVISKNLKKVRKKETDFYDNGQLQLLWDSQCSSVFPDLDTELLEYKKQMVLYGPPGTSKTYSAKQLAEEIIRYRLTKDLGVKIFHEENQGILNEAIEKNVRRLQLHPAYSYEDFIRGLQFEGGNTKYKDGYLLKLLEKMKDQPDVPHVLILDEINRVDLSRLFGECFSALENRGEEIDLLGQEPGDESKLKIPDNLYIIGTMNLIDHSVEQLDFALRRRFLWLEATYNENALLEICKFRWEALEWLIKKYSWEDVADDFEKLKSAATNLNKEISKDGNELGANFVLGHVFFIDVVKFLHMELQSKGNYKGQLYLYGGEGAWRNPIEKLWKLSLQPLLKEYLAGISLAEQKIIMKKLKDSFKP